MLQKSIHFTAILGCVKKVPPVDSEASLQSDKLVFGKEKFVPVKVTESSVIVCTHGCCAVRLNNLELFFPRQLFELLVQSRVHSFENFFLESWVQHLNVVLVHVKIVV